MSTLKLSRRESEVILLIASGLTDAQIADKMGVSVNDVYKYGLFIRQKLGLYNRSQIVIYCYENSLIPEDMNKEYRL